MDYHLHGAGKHRPRCMGYAIPKQGVRHTCTSSIQQCTCVKCLQFSLGDEAARRLAELLSDTPKGGA